MAKTNQQKGKDPVLDEIEKDETPLDDKGNPLTVVPPVSVEDLLSKDPEKLSAADMDFLSEHKDDLTDEQKVAVGLADPDTTEKEEEVEEEVIEEKKPVKPEVVAETQEEKDQRYKSQQAEAQIQNERNKALINKADEIQQIKDPTIDELKSFVAQDGVTWEELTTFEQATAKRTYLAEKKFNLLNEGIQEQKQVDVWSKKVDDFIDSTDSKPEFIELSSHETEFRKFALKDSHRGTPIDVLLGAFLHQLPKDKPNRGSLFERGGGGDKVQRKDGIVDADQAAKLRTSDPREYKRLLKAGKIKLEI